MIVHYLDRYPTESTDPDYHNELVSKLSTMGYFKAGSMKKYNTKFFNVERLLESQESALEWKNFIFNISNQFKIPLAGIDIFETA